MMPMRKVLSAACVAALACSAIACEDGLFAPRAPAGRATLSIAATVAGGSASAFDKVDAVHVLLTKIPLVFDVAQQVPGNGARYDIAQGTAELGLDTTFAFRPTGDETRISLPVDLSAAVDTAYVYAYLQSAGSVVFVGTATAVLKRGETTPVTMSLSPRAAGISTVGVPSLTALGDTIWGHAAVLFSTGDTIRTAKPRWISLNPLIVATPQDSMLVAVAEGQAQVQVSYASVYGPLSQSVTVLVNAVVASVSVSPPNATVPLSAGTMLYTAVARDRRRNVLVRTAAWSSSNPLVARIDATTGFTTLLSAGTTYIKATIGTVRDSTLLTVQTGPAAPTNLTAAGGSSAQINLAWNDNSNNETEFRVERCSGTGCTSFVQVFTVTGTTQYVGATNNFDAPVATDSVYSYRVRAFNATGLSPYTNVATARPLARETTPPSAPTLTATARSGYLVELSWTHPGTNVVGFVIERGVGVSNYNFTQIATLYGTGIRGYQDGTLPNTYYRYRVTAFNAAGGATSNETSLFTPTN